MQAFIRFFLIFFLFINIAVAAPQYSDNKNLFFKTNKDIKVKLQVNESDIKTFNVVNQYLDKRDWSDALSWADSIKSENFKDSLVNYVLWKKYSNISVNEVDTEFDNLMSFIMSHGYLPNIKDLKLKAETMYMNNDIPYEFVAEYFDAVKPIKTKTAIKLLIGKYNSSEDKKNSKLVKDIISTFYDYDFDNDEMSLFLSRFEPYLTESNFAFKIESLLWEKQYLKANYIMNRLGVDNRILYSGIMEIDKNPKYINNILRSMPKNLRENELLLYTRFIYYHKQKDSDEAIQILLSLKKQTLRPEKWWIYQRYYARELLSQEKYKAAYQISNNSNLKPTDVEYSESEWLSGWIALTFLNKPRDSYIHFNNMYNSVTYPISKSRAAYWVGRALEADNNKKDAVMWYDIGSKYPLYFYGQLSFQAKNELLDVPSLTGKNPLPEPPAFTSEEENNALNSDIVKIAYMMVICNDNRKEYTSLFTSAINSAKSQGEMSAIFEIIKNTENEELITKMAKYLTYKDVYFIDNLFPVLNIINLENPNSHLVHSIIKQESGFHVSATSHVGATGFMQLMPATAKEVSRQLGLRYSEKALRTNPAYNILLGSYYINSLIKRFDGSQVLAIASYNAGAAPVSKWIKTYGDPRDMKNIKDIVNWIELISYSETRNYVQRIIESSIVYEYILETVEQTNVNSLNESK